MVPGDRAGGVEPHAYPLRRLLLHHLAHLRWELAAVRIARRVAREDGHAVAGHLTLVALDRHIALEHRPAQRLVLDSVLDLNRRMRVALEVPRLLRLGERPADEIAAVLGHVPERHEVRAAARAECGDGHHLLLRDEIA